MQKWCAPCFSRGFPHEGQSAGIFQVAFGLLGAEGNVVLPAHEFPANVYPWMRAADVGGPEVRLVPCPDGRVTAERLAPAVDAATRAVAVSLVDFVTGFRVDLEELRAAFPGPLLVVDGIQGLGAVAASLAPADVLVAGGQKWMRAGWGSGVMAVGDRALERLAPTLTGWTGVERFLDFTAPPPHPILDAADRFQEGSPPFLGTLQLGAAAEVIEALAVGLADFAQKEAFETGAALTIVGAHLSEEPMRFSPAASAAIT